MSIGLVVSTTSAAAAFAAIGACANDFDALFGERAGGEAGVDATAAPDAATTPVDAGAETGPGGCTPGGICGATDACDGGLCTFACTGCACQCAQYKCPKTDGISRCETECTEGTSCDVLCNTAGACVHTCEACTRGVFACASGAKSCTVSCTGASNCTTTCAPAAPCSVTCAPGAACLVTCNGATSCDVLGCPSGVTDCGNGVKACNRACP